MRVSRAHNIYGWLMAVLSMMQSKQPQQYSREHNALTMHTSCNELLRLICQTIKSEQGVREEEAKKKNGIFCGAQSIKVIFYEASFMWVFTIKLSHYYFYYFRYTFIVIPDTAHSTNALTQNIRYASFGILTQFYSLQWWSKPSEIAVFVAIDAAVAVVVAKPHSFLCASPSSQPFQFIICLSAANIMRPIVRYRFLFCLWKCIVIERIKWPEVQKRTTGEKNCEHQHHEACGGLEWKCSVLDNDSLPENSKTMLRIDVTWVVHMAVINSTDDKFESFYPFLVFE